MGQITIVHCGVKNKNGIMSRVLRRALSAYGGVQWFDGAAVSCPDQTPRFLLYECTGIPQITSGAGILVFDNGFVYSQEASRAFSDGFVPILEGELKYFYPDYKNYYYLPQEDTAVHKSLGEFVDRSARKKATAATCYTRKKGRFLPQPQPLFDPVLKACYQDKQTFFPYTPDLFDHPDTAVFFLNSVLKRLCPRLVRPE